MLIRVRYTDDSYDMIKPWRLQEFISSGRIAAFLRSDGWVAVSRDPLRRGNDRRYSGPERRRRDNNTYEAA
ncbi:GSU3473 family protein [Geobacter pickeringii]|uniref:Uncharacterized protein n=1 Tax=Geobacter pickeringii TaxID=345632 RepID=A0A0B5BD37_9BACT|nr:hypothetical protein [Geobacter pickeringii]AJE04638.1 hypothetical protein GPICK_15805 [Geobacter pickeringii]